jgi:hypothetical protein
VLAIVAVLPLGLTALATFLSFDLFSLGFMILLYLPALTIWGVFSYVRKVFLTGHRRQRSIYVTPLGYVTPHLSFLS